MGVKQNRLPALPSASPRGEPAGQNKPAWINKRIDLRAVQETKALLQKLNLNTVCQKAFCPNIGECFRAKHATFLILGEVCTRNCSFCGIKKGAPHPLDPQEPLRVARAVKLLNLKHAVITSVTRDDLADGGAEIFAEVIKQLRFENPKIKIEVLIPDFLGKVSAIEKVIKAGPDIIGHNLETVPRLYKKVRPGADYQGSLGVLKRAKEAGDTLFVKSGIMLGLGEREKEVIRVFKDLRRAGCDLLSIGQYLAPSAVHYPIQEYIHPERFLFYKNEAYKFGFSHVESAPYVRSSFFASSYFNIKNS